MAKGNRGGKRGKALAQPEAGENRVGFLYQETLREATAYLESQGTDRYSARQDIEEPVLTSAQRNAYEAIGKAADNNEPTAKKYGKKTLQATLEQVRYDRSGHERRAFQGLEEDRASIDRHKKKREQYVRMEATIRRVSGE